MYPGSVCSKLLQLLCNRFHDTCVASLASCLALKVVQAYLHRFLTVHSDVISEHESLAHVAEGLAATQASANRHLRGLLQKNLCLIKFFTNAPAM